MLINNTPARIAIFNILQIQTHNYSVKTYKDKRGYVKIGISSFYKSISYKIVLSPRISYGAGNRAQKPCLLN